MDFQFIYLWTESYDMVNFRKHECDDCIFCIPFEKILKGNRNVKKMNYIINAYQTEISFLFEE